MEDNRPDEEKSNEEMQREILLAQKRMLDEQERKKANKWKPTPANIALIVFLAIAVIWIGACVFDAVDDNRRREENVERIKESLLSESLGSDRFIRAIPLIQS